MLFDMTSEEWMESWDALNEQIRGHAEVPGAGRFASEDI